MRLRAIAILLIGAWGCATPGQVKRVETRISMMEREQERRDSTHLAALRSILQAQNALIDSLKNTEEAISLAKGQSSADLLEIRRSMQVLQEQLNQSKQQLSEFYSELDARQSALQAQRTTDSTSLGDSGSTANTAPAGVATAQQMIQAGYGQLNQGAFGTAREVFQQMLVTHPLSSLVPDALYGIAESYSTSNPDSATAYYREVADNHPESMRAASAMYKLGARAQQAGDMAVARKWFEKVAQPRYRGTDEYGLAVERLRQLP